ncbi:hypothetical protein PG991_006635 [Apiospora marii]|uniref:Uncharacterized protein n=1 Tax=Apiospora marii TaxID=335849 RepID=A0ABR1RZP6_9PEZI
MDILRACPKLRQPCITGTRDRPGGITESGLRWLRQDPAVGRVLSRLWLVDQDVTQEEYRRLKAFRKLSKARPHLDVVEGVMPKVPAETPEVAAESKAAIEQPEVASKQPEVAAEPEETSEHVITKGPKISKRHGITLVPVGPPDGTGGG